MTIEYENAIIAKKTYSPIGVQQWLNAKTMILWFWFLSFFL